MLNKVVHLTSCTKPPLLRETLIERSPPARLPYPWWRVSPPPSQPRTPPPSDLALVGGLILLVT
jgi:hypothetical protein